MMHSKHLLFFLALFLFCSINIQAQVKKIDTTLKIDGRGYYISCNNKNADRNTVTVNPVSLDAGSRSVFFDVKGRVAKAEIGDLNDDGLPELLVYIYGVPNPETGTVICISVENKSLVTVFFPDIYSDPMLREGYKGNDEFSVRDGMLVRSFPLYKPGDADNKPNGGKRVIQYQMLPDEGHFGFKVIRSYIIAP